MFPFSIPKSVSGELSVLRTGEYRRMLNTANWSYFDKLRGYVRLAGDDVHAFAPVPSYAYVSMALPSTPYEQLNLVKRIARRYTQMNKIYLHDAPKGKPRIGYIGARLAHMHVSGQLFGRLLTMHSDDVEVFCYLTRVPKDDTVNWQRLRNAKNITLVDLSTLSDVDAAVRIHQDRIDALISTDGWLDDSRPMIPALTPARYNIWWQGTATSSGAPWMDYVVTDKDTSPTIDGWCTEKELVLPDIYYNACHCPEATRHFTRSDLGLKDDSFVFMSLNVTMKINPDVWDVWCKILLACPNSVLVLLDPGDVAQANFRKELFDRVGDGVSPDRLVFWPRVDAFENISRMGVADLYLDPWPMNGHTTLAESLWAGTPAITYRGETFAQRVGASMLRSVGLKDNIHTTVESYIQHAIALYHDRDALLLMRMGMAIKDSDMYHGDRQAKHIETFIKNNLM